MRKHHYIEMEKHATKYELISSIDFYSIVSLSLTVSVVYVDYGGGGGDDGDGVSSLSTYLPSNVRLFWYTSFYLRHTHTHTHTHDQCNISNQKSRNHFYSNSEQKFFLFAYF